MLPHTVNSYDCALLAVSAALVIASTVRGQTTVAVAFPPIGDEFVVETAAPSTFFPQPTNPIPNGIPDITTEAGCVDGFLNPSEECLDSLNVSTQGTLYKDSSCSLMSATDQALLQTAFKDAHTIGASMQWIWGYNQSLVEEGIGSAPYPSPRTVQALEYYMGPDVVSSATWLNLIYSK